MAWEWSHTNEAYEAARENLGKLPRYRLLEIMREWAYFDREKNGTLRTRVDAKRIAGFRLPKGIRRLPSDILADKIWERMEALATCDNGGWNAYACPDGCHTVSFSSQEDK